MEDLGHPVSYLVAKRGIPVFSSDGEKLGRVVRVSAAPEANMFDGILFDESGARAGAASSTRRRWGRSTSAASSSRSTPAEAGQLPKRRP